MSYADINKDGVITLSTEILSESDFYPFGLKKKGVNTIVRSHANSIAERFKFNNKEYTEALGFNLYEYGSRLYDPAAILFTSIDPKATDFYFQSPYVYAADNPIYFQEKDGENPIRAAITAFKIAKRAYKAYKKVTKAGKKFTKKHLKDIGLDEIADIAGDLATLFGNSEVGMFDRIQAASDLLIGTDFNSKGKKALGNLVEKANDLKKSFKKNFKGKKKNKGKRPGSKGHKDHQDKVNELEDKAKGEATVGEKVLKEKKINHPDSNRNPDVQFVGKDGKTRMVFEAERKPKSKRNKKREKEYKDLGIEQETHKVGN